MSQVLFDNRRSESSRCAAVGICLPAIRRVHLVEKLSLSTTRRYWRNLNAAGNLLKCNKKM